ncbi:hypothetical protein [uncultured Shimia sp.]|uniref:hypothetical protein n=1 Tax=uncultured Shimia sp. TaxID=573152 RepID=UPI00261E9035|nr:hypothetical protein [uncultured Shimia sp.]
MSNDTPNTVAEMATQQGALKRDTLTLIGIMGGATTMRALIMLPSGRVITAKQGQKSSVGTVVGIDETRVVLLRGGKELTLEMPS